MAFTRLGHRSHSISSDQQDAAANTGHGPIPSLITGERKARRVRSLDRDEGRVRRGRRSACRTHHADDRLQVIAGITPQPESEGPTRIGGQLPLSVSSLASAAGTSGNPASRTKFPPRRRTSHTYLTTTEVAALAQVRGQQHDVILLLAHSGMRFGELVGLCVGAKDPVRRSTQVGGKLIEGNPDSAIGRRSISIPQRLLRILTNRVSSRSLGPRHHLAQRRAARTRELEGLHEIARRHRPGRSTQGARARPPPYVRLTRPTSRRAYLRLLQKTMGHASITVTAHVYADLFDDGARLSCPEIWPNFGLMTRAVGCNRGNDVRPIKATELKRSVWPGPGSNRRPSAFQADARTN